MNKTEIQSLDNTSLIAHVLNLETRLTNEGNSRRGITKATLKEYKWTIEETAKRFNLDFKTLTNKMGASHFWE